MEQGAQRAKTPGCVKASGRPGKTSDEDGSADLRLAYAAHRAETLLEFINPAFGIDKLLLAGEERMGIRGNTDGNDAVLHTVDDFLPFGGLGGAADEPGTRGHIHKDNRIVFRMNVLFHENFRVPSRFRRSGTRRLAENIRLSSSHPQAISTFFVRKEN